MSDYSKTYDGAAKDSSNDTILGADFDTEFSNIGTMSGTKADKVVGAVSGNIAELDGNGNLVDSGVTVATAGVVGAVMAFAMSTSPTGWLETDGTAVSRTTYADLFAAIGTAYGVGDGSTTFNLPDLRGEFIRGWDNGRGVDSGRAIATTQTDDFKSHGHTWGVNDKAPAVGTGGPGFGTGASNTGLTGGTETRPRNIAMMYCIKF